MFGLGPWELTIILVLLVFFFGGKRLGDIGGSLGKSISEFKKAIRHDEPKSAPEIQEPSARKAASEAREAASPAGLRDEPSGRGKEEEKSP